jgi:hypothetical protein
VAARLAGDLRKALRVGSRRAEAAAAEATAKVMTRVDAASMHAYRLRQSACFAALMPSLVSFSCSALPERHVCESAASEVSVVVAMQEAEAEAASEVATDTIIRLGLAAFAVSAYIKTTLCPSLSSYTPRMSSASLVLSASRVSASRPTPASLLNGRFHHRAASCV